MPLARNAALLALASLALAAAPARARHEDARATFYDAKRQTTSREAYAQALARLDQVQIGLGEEDFLGAMGMQVLTRRGKPYDVLMEGYLAEASRERNQGAGAHRRALVFGYLEDGRPQVGFTVWLVDHRVSEVRADADTLAAGLAP